MPYPDTAEGFVIKDQKNWQNFEKQEFKLKPFEDRDIDIAIECCGVCGSDVHTINGGWGECPLPVCVGHEIVGKAVKVGKGVKTVKVGDRVGAGAQVGADLTCVNCNTNNENYCPKQIGTYGAFYDDGTMSQGGFASHIRVHEYFVFQIPHAIESEVAAPMLCAGLTVYSPLVRLGAGPGKKVAIRGLGGLGHFAVQFAKALGAEVYVLSHTPSKEQDAKELGADHFIDTNQEDWQTPYKFTFDFIINSADVINNFNLQAYFSTLKVHGKFHCVGLADHAFPTLAAFDFAGNGNYIGASHLGSRPEMIAMFDLVAMRYPKIKTWIHTVPVGVEGCAQAVDRLYKDEVRYRYVLTDYDKAFGKRT